MTNLGSSQINDCSKSFRDDYTQLEKDAYALKEAEHDEKNYSGSKLMNKINNFFTGNPQKSAPGFPKGKYPEGLLMLIVEVIFGGYLNKANSLDLSTEAASVRVQTDLSNMSNSLQTSIHSGTGTTSVENVAVGTQVMMRLLGTSGNLLPKGVSGIMGSVPGAKKPTSFNLSSLVQEAVGEGKGKGAQFMYDNFAAMRAQFDWVSPTSSLDKAFNPASGAQFEIGGKSSGSSGSSGPMTNFEEMRDRAEEQGSVGTGARTARTAFVNAYNQNISVVQTMGTAANSEIGLITSRIKMDTNAMSDFAQDLLTANRQAVRNQVPQ